MNHSPECTELSRLRTFMHTEPHETRRLVTSNSRCSVSWEDRATGLQFSFFTFSFIFLLYHSATVSLDVSSRRYRFSPFGSASRFRVFVVLHFLGLSLFPFALFVVSTLVCGLRGCSMLLVQTYFPLTVWLWDH